MLLVDNSEELNKAIFYTTKFSFNKFHASNGFWPCELESYDEFGYENIE